MKPEILLHACCGPCATSCIERLIQAYTVYVYYYNPNITDVEEYYLRRDNLVKFINAYNDDNPYGFVTYIEGKYDPKEYLARTEALKHEPEGGRRCAVCFDMRLEETACTAKKLGIDKFTTSMTVSPHKNYKLISETGFKYAEKYGLEYVAEDFKKKNGFARSVELSKQYGLYRQKFCGCEYARNR